MNSLYPQNFHNLSPCLTCQEGAVRGGGVGGGGTGNEKTIIQPPLAIQFQLLSLLVAFPPELIILLALPLTPKSKELVLLKSTSGSVII